MGWGSRLDQNPSEPSPNPDLFKHGEHFLSEVKTAIETEIQRAPGVKC